MIPPWKLPRSSFSFGACAFSSGRPTPNNTDGSPSWGPEQVAGTWKAVDAPSITAGDGGVQIAAIGPGGSLWFYWAYDGTNTWHPQELCGPGTTFASPAMTTSAGTYEIASLTQ